MKLGIIIYSAEAETVWNAFRLGVFSQKAGDEVKIFLLAKGVESEQLTDSNFNVPDQMSAFVDAGGDIQACGTCLKIRQTAASDLCPLSTMQDLHEIVRNSDHVLPFQAELDTWHSPSRLFNKSWSNTFVEIISRR